MLEIRKLQEKDADNLKRYLSDLFAARERTSLENPELVALVPQFLRLAADPELRFQLDRSHNFAAKLRSGHIGHGGTAPSVHILSPHRYVASIF
jgi:hypothetical protein